MWSVHGCAPSTACLRVSTAARAKALGFPADARATAVRMRERWNIFLFSPIFHSMCSWFPSESRVLAVAFLIAFLNVQRAHEQHRRPTRRRPIAEAGDPPTVRPAGVRLQRP